MKIENIKFKAKRLNNGEWVYGSLIRSTAGVKEKAYIVDSFSSMSDYSVVCIDPSTICQFTGLKDCKGKEIWEGAFFFRYLSQFSGYNYQTVGGEWRVYCIPYIGNESLLGTTKDVEG